MNMYCILPGIVTITGGGASTTTIEGVAKGGVVHISAGFTVKLSGVTMRGSVLGGIGNDGTLTLSDCSVSDTGGGISNGGTLTLVCEQHGQQEYFQAAASQEPHSDANQQHGQRQSTQGGILKGGGIYNSGALTLINSTVSSNSAQTAAASTTAEH